MKEGGKKVEVVEWRMILVDKECEVSLNNMDSLDLLGRIYSDRRFQRT